MWYCLAREAVDNFGAYIEPRYMLDYVVFRLCYSAINTLRMGVEEFLVDVFRLCAEIRDADRSEKSDEILFDSRLVLREALRRASSCWIDQADEGAASNEDAFLSSSSDETDADYIDISEDCSDLDPRPMRPLSGDFLPPYLPNLGQFCESLALDNNRYL